MKTNIFLNNFPGNQPRPQQVEALEKISNYFFDKQKKFVIARMPTGSGKSHIATAIANSSTPIEDRRKIVLENYDAFKMDKNGNYVHSDLFLNSPPWGGVVLTVTKSLQDQYIELFSNLIMAKGKTNYNCNVDPNLTVDFAPCLFSSSLKQDCFNKDRCDYYRTRKNALISSSPIFNYRSFWHIPDFLQRREFLILDEADKLESELVGQYSITLNYATLQAEEIFFKKVISDDAEEAYQWITNIFLQLKDIVTDLKTKIALLTNKATKFEGIVFKQMQRLGKLNSLMCNLSDVISNWQSCEYLVESKDAKEVTFVPYDIKPLAQKFFDNGNKILLMSATISNPIKFAKSLGIKEKEYEFLDIKSVFEAQKSPIFCSTKYSLSYKTLNVNLPKILDIVEKICENHKGQKGLIHTHTNSITDLLKKKVSNNKRFLFRELGYTNEDIVLEHKTREREDTILVSPSLDTGISLDDDLGRFQIIIKAPYLPLGSKRIKKLFDKDPEYYSMKMLDTLIQMCGRCTRSKEDHSVTYILDGSVVKAVMNNKKFLPKYFLDRFQ